MNESTIQPGQQPGLAQVRWELKIDMYINLEPKWPLFLKVDPGTVFSNQNKGHLGSRNILYCNYTCIRITFRHIAILMK